MRDDTGWRDAYLKLHPRVALKNLERPYLYHILHDELYELVLEPRSAARRRHAQTAGFNVILVPVGASSRRFGKRLLFTLLPILSRNDDGRLRLD